MKRRTPYVLLLAAAIGVTFASPSRSDETGDRWRITSSMTMGAMTMPSNTSEVCAAHRTDAAPVKTDSNCQITENKRVGNKQTLKMHCSGAHPADATVEMVYDGPDHYKGQMLMTSEKGQMTMNMEGQKLTGTCDPSAQGQQARAMAEQLKGQNAANMQAACADSAKKLETMVFVGPMAQCKDADSVRAYCDHVRTVDGYSTLASREQGDAAVGNLPPNMRTAMAHPLTASGQLCSIDMSQLRNKLCASADGRTQAAFVVGQCPAQAGALAQRECSGRESSALLGSPYGEFCSRYAAQQTRTSPSGTVAGSAGAGATAGATGSTAPATPPAQGAAGNTSQQQGGSPTVDQAKDAATNAINKGTSLIKGLFGH